MDKTRRKKKALGEEQHHHRSSFTGHKPFKRRHGHASKSSVKTKAKGRIDKTADESKVHKPMKRQPNRINRKNAAKQALRNKQVDFKASSKIFQGRHGVARIVTIVPLCADVESHDVASALIKSVTPESIAVDQDGIVQELFPVLDACKLSDFVILVMSATEEVDEIGETIIRTLAAQGIGNVLPAVSSLDSISSLKHRTQVKGSLISFINHFFPDQQKVYALDSAHDAGNAIRLLCMQTIEGINWRDQRSYCVPTKFNYSNEDKELAIQGTIRGHGLHADRLLHLPGFGDFQINRICAFDAKDDAMLVDTQFDAGRFPILPSDLQDSNEKYARSDVVMQAKDDSYFQHKRVKGVRMDDHCYFDDSQDDMPVKLRVPKGTSAYQAAWMVDESSDDDDDLLYEEILLKENEDEIEKLVEGSLAEDTEMSEYDCDSQSDMHSEISDETGTCEMKEFRDQQRALFDDLQFPDEVELDPTKLARERLRKFRGLKSFDHSPWDPAETDERTPVEWNKLLRLRNYKSTKLRVIKQSLQTADVEAGEKVTIWLRDFPQEEFSRLADIKYIAPFALHQHESQYSVLQFSVIPNTEYKGVIRSKDDLILQIGGRRFRINPLFSQAATPSSTNRIQKYDRYFSQGRPALATIIGPANFGADPITLFKESPDGVQLVATGSFTEVTPDSVIVKRIVLTGHPVKIHKKKVTVRYMFFNAGA